MTNKTMFCVEQELLERIAQWGSVTWMDKNELRAILAQPVCGTCNTVIRHDELIGSACECSDKANVPLTNEGNMSAVIGTVVGGDCSDNTVTVQVIGDVPSKLWTMGEAVTLTHGHLTATTDFDAMQADHNRLVRELDVLLNGEAGAADQASLCDIVAQVRMARKKPGSGALQLLALVPDQVVGRVHHNQLHWEPVRGVLNSCGRALPDSAPLYDRPTDILMRYVRAPSRKDPKYHEEWPEIEGGPVFDGVTYCNDLFEALKRFNVIVAETMPENSVDE